MIVTFANTVFSKRILFNNNKMTIRTQICIVKSSNEKAINQLLINNYIYMLK